MELRICILLLSCYFKFNCVAAKQAEGSPCEYKDGSEGVCLKMSDCKIALKEMKRLKFPKFCSFNVWKPLVCCVDCRALDNVMGSGFLVPGYEKINDFCLEGFYDALPCNRLSVAFEDLDDSVVCYNHPYTVSSVIAGGYAAQHAEFPHMALIGYGDDRDSADWMCGGSVISEKYILTAAHCISSPLLGEIKYAALGLLSRNDPRDVWQIYDIVKIIGYPGYQPPSKYHDIALLATGVKIRYNLEVLPACLHRGQNLAKVAIATGWGALGHRKPLADVLQVVNVEKFSDAECSKAYPVHRHLKSGYNSTTQVCYGDEEQINDTCEGDSGGPLQVKTEGSKKSKCLFTIIGVTSYGRSCGFVGSSGMYTRVSHYIPWIESITGKLI